MKYLSLALKSLGIVLIVIGGVYYNSDHGILSLLTDLMDSMPFPPFSWFKFVFFYCLPGIFIYTIGGVVENKYKASKIVNNSIVGIPDRQ